MKKADEFSEPWEYYIGFARLLAQHYEETHDTRLMRLKSTLEGSGWEFTYLNSEFRWVTTCPALRFRVEVSKRLLRISRPTAFQHSRGGRNAGRLAANDEALSKARDGKRPMLFGKHNSVCEVYHSPFMPNYTKGGAA